jgi:hypothetical protein
MHAADRSTRFVSFFDLGILSSKVPQNLMMLQAFQLLLLLSYLFPEPEYLTIARVWAFFASAVRFSQEELGQFLFQLA